MTVRIAKSVLEVQEIPESVTLYIAAIHKNTSPLSHVLLHIIIWGHAGLKLKRAVSRFGARGARHNTAAYTSVYSVKRHTRQTTRSPIFTGHVASLIQVCPALKQLPIQAALIAIDCSDVYKFEVTQFL